ncbi:hypothetical protein N5P37_012037 [Trichoderma harzianum]|nr:hypothetical protein N5P37_012037 [Trichoderma harzianum]
MTVLTARAAPSAADSSRFGSWAYRVGKCVRVWDGGLVLDKLSLGPSPDAPRKMVEKERKGKKRLGGYPPATGSEKRVAQKMTTMAAWNNAMHASRTCVALPLCHAQTFERPVKQVKQSRIREKGSRSSRRTGKQLQRFGGSKGGCRFVSSSAVQEQERRPGGGGGRSVSPIVVFVSVSINPCLPAFPFFSFFFSLLFLFFFSLLILLPFSTIRAYSWIEQDAGDCSDSDEGEMIGCNANREQGKDDAMHETRQRQRQRWSNLDCPAW